MNLTTTQWLDYTAERPQHSVTGILKLLPNFFSPQLNNQRDVLVWLPESYYHQENTSRRYPVLYMHDAQNLFDRYTSFVGVEWGVDETMQQLSLEGREAIIVGLYHAGDSRAAEYNPFHKGLVRGELYLEFIVNTLKPLIDRDFRTLSDRVHTGIMGSSMGGLISLYAYFQQPDVFGFMGAMSPSLWVGHGALYNFVRNASTPPGRIYVDCGTREMSADGMRSLLQEKGYQVGRALRYVREEGGDHSEAAWGRRLPDALRFLLP
jgi:isoamylase